MSDKEQTAEMAAEAYWKSKAATNYHFNREAVAETWKAALSWQSQREGKELEEAIGILKRGKQLCEMGCVEEQHGEDSFSERCGDFLDRLLSLKKGNL